MIEYKIAETNDVNSIKELYTSIFKEKQEAVELFFERIFDTSFTYIAKDGEKLVSMLFMLPCSVNGVKACYMFAVATDEKYRGQGTATALIDYALKNTDAQLCLTLPASESLYDFYEKNGFTALNVNTAQLTRAELSSLSKPYPLTDPVVKGYCGIRSRILKENFLFWNNKFLDFAFDYYRIYGAKVFKSNFGYAVAYEEDGVCKVIEMICADDNAPYLITDLLSDFSCDKFQFHLSPMQKFIESSPERFGMVKYLSDNNFENIYCSLTLD